MVYVWNLQPCFAASSLLRDKIRHGEAFKMAAGYIAPPYASTIEEEANLQEVRYRINSLKSQNEALRDEMKRVMKDNHKQTEKAFWARRHTQDLQDRAQYIRIATISNPAPIGQYCPKLKGGRFRAKALSH
ncbi:unnamed protein product [Effrenium voratum]|nr:unnamed protein product [Effrenium voratum]